MIHLILAFLFIVHAEIKTSNTDDQAAGNSGAHALADKFANFSKCAKDPKVWPKTLFNENQISFLDENGKAWSWSAKSGLKPVTNASEVAEIMKASKDRIWGKITSRTPNEVVVNMKASVDQANFTPPGGHKEEPMSAECNKATESLIKVNSTLPQVVAEKDPVKHTFGVGVHESMHVHDQNSPSCWSHTLKDNLASMSRTNAYPVDVSPRQMRYKLKVALKRALDAPAGTGRQRYLEEAAYWHDAYKTWNNSGGKIKEPSGPDIFEGSAKYLEMIAQKLDCSKPITQEQLARASRDAVREGTSEHPQPTADTEAYYLGALSGALLDQRAIDWKSKNMAGVSPLDQLLKDVRKTRGALKDEQSLDAISGSGPKRNEICNVKPDMDYLANYKDTKNYAWVSIPSESFQGQGTYDAKSVIRESEKVHVGSSATGGNLGARNMPLVVSSANPCGAKHIMVLVERSKILDGHVNFSRDDKPGSGVTGPVASTPMSSSVGDVYCGR